MLPTLLLLALPAAEPKTPPGDRLTDASAVAARIDSLTQAVWQDNGLSPSPPSSDLAFLRRLTLDLAGRIPTVREAQAFAEDRSPDSRQRAIQRLMLSPEYPLHLGRVLDDAIQEKFAGDPEFLAYLRTALADNRPWDQMFRDIIAGPWVDKTKGADRFLARRLANPDDVTIDTARIFFGVNVSCAKCHDHPLVADWKQDHYFGMASFFNRTQGGGKGKNANTPITEKNNGEVMFVTVKGERRTAKMMFLSGQVIEDPPTKNGPFSRRGQLVKSALEDRIFLRRAIVNRLWAYFLGRGLVHPTDQVHSANPSSVPELLEWLGDDLADHGYNLHRLVAGIVTSKVYQLASVRNEKAAKDEDVEGLFARGALRPLTPQQYALSLVLALGDGSFEAASKPDAPAREDVQKRYRDLEGQASQLTRFTLLDPRGERYQASAGEALFLSNHPEVQKWTAPAAGNLAARLIAATDTKQLLQTAYWTILSRPVQPEELTFLTQWLEERKTDRARAISQLLWALVASAEFRFNY